MFCSVYLFLLESYSLTVSVLFCLVMSVGEESSSLTLSVLLFAKAAELVGSDSARLTLPCSCSAAEILHHLITQYPVLSPIQNCVILALNQNYIHWDESVHLQADSELAVIPPISGG